MLDNHNSTMLGLRRQELQRHHRHIYTFNDTMVDTNVD